MLKYHNFVSEEKLPTLSAKLSWSHYDEILRFDDINKNVKKITHDKTIGIIICRKNNKFVMEYCSDKRILTKEYELI